MAHPTKHAGHGKVYTIVWACLLALTIITVAVSYHNFGIWNIFVAMLVATIKGTLVCLFFMHLKYDNRVNQVIFVSSFCFLAVFVGLTASDELFRKEPKEGIKVQESAPPSAADMNKLRIATPALVEKGKQTFAVQCAVCHGPLGQGNGPGAAALNPKPRDFTSGYWRFGGQPTHVFKTISEGSPGTGMASFSSLSVEDRWSLVHFVRSLSPNAPEDETTNDKIQMTKEENGPKEKIPLSFAMKKMAETNVSATDTTTVENESQELGAKVYQARCMSCHGAHGKGGIPVAKVSVNPFVYLKTSNLANAGGTWMSDRSQFIDLVSKGLPGSGMPGQANFSDEEWSALYQYIQSLRFHQ